MTIPLLRGLGVELPVLAAPMAGGPSTPEFVVAAARAGGLGFLPGGYLTADALAARIDTVAGTGVPFGVNLFAPAVVPITEAAYRRYADELRPRAEAYGIDLAAIPRTEDTDSWDDKLAVALDARPAIVTTTFGLPPAAALRALRTAGIAFGATVTSVAEARAARDAGADLLIVQGRDAGGHSGTTTPEVATDDLPLRDLVAAVAAAVDLPIIAAGGIAHASHVDDVLAAGAGAAAVGTALLLTDESGASATHRAALVDPQFTRTVITRAFTGRPARALATAWTDAHGDAPLGYPALHHLTSGLRRAAAAAGDPHGMHLWAGTGWRAARAEPLAATLHRLASGWVR